MSFRSRLTVLFQAPFWVGIYERTDDEGYQVCRVVFGPEPKDYEVYAFLLENWRTLSFSPAVEVEEREEYRDNPAGDSPPTGGGAGARHQGPAGTEPPEGAAGGGGEAPDPGGPGGGGGAPVRPAPGEEAGQAPGTVGT